MREGLKSTHAQLIEVVQQLSRARDLETIQAIVRTAARRLTGADGATFVLRDGTQCYYADEDAISPLWKGQRFPLSACISGWAMLNGRAVAIEDIYADPRIPHDAYRPTFVKSLAMVPIRAPDSIGAIGNYWATQHLPSDEEIALLQALADSTSIALENVNLYQELKAQIRERSEALELARKAEAEARHELRERLNAEATVRRVEEQLRQSQKMDAVGQLAGGVAHDFNNILSVILSISSMLQSELKEEDPVRADIDEIRKAGERAAGLTRQLLILSRKQNTEPKVIEPNDNVRSMGKMLNRLIGENVELDVRTHTTRAILIDPGQLEQVLLNLVVNARDAMPRGGKITLETGSVYLDDEYARVHLDVTPGHYVMVAVSDSGVGMSKEVQEHIFEPFFTTKDKGKGTGLGLSTVYSIVKQNHGHIWVYSEPGVGTSFKIYFPEQEREDILASHQLADAKLLKGSETILLVEDDEQVRAVARDILRRGGYNVLETRSAGEALLACEQFRGKIHLLLTDVVMPQLSGVELAERLHAVREGMKTVCMSGYTDDAVARHGVIDSTMAFVQKPLTPQSLLLKIRQVLDQPGKS